MKKGKILHDIYTRLFTTFGPQHWWPGETPFEVMIGAILTQNTAWKNVEKAIVHLKDEGLMEPKRLARVSRERLAPLIRSSGYYNQKAEKIGHFMTFLGEEYGLNIGKMTREETDRIREKLLGINGIGPETADSILLYALKKPVFVIDAYTYRVLTRHGLVDEGATYEEMQDLFMDSMPHDEKLFNEYHALFVRLGKTFCLKNPLCPLGNAPRPSNGRTGEGGRKCPLEELLS